MAASNEGRMGAGKLARGRMAATKKAEGSQQGGAWQLAKGWMGKKR